MGAAFGRNRNLGTISAAEDLDLTNAYLLGYNLRGAVLSFASCHQTDFTGTDLSNSDLSYVDTFEDAAFDDADLTDANFDGSIVSVEQMLRADTLYGATLPHDVYKEIERRKPELLAPPAEEE